MINPDRESRNILIHIARSGQVGRHRVAFGENGKTARPWDTGRAEPEWREGGWAPAPIRPPETKDSSPARVGRERIASGSESRQTDASCQRFAPSSEAAAIGAGAIAETALNASACPAPN